MKERLLLFIKGFIIGIAKIIPGVSGALLAITFNIYDKGLDAITHFFSNVKENVKFLLYLGLGLVASILIFSKIINYAINNYYLITMLFFLGLIMGGIPTFYKKIKKKNYLLIIIGFVIIMAISVTNINNNYVMTNTIKDYTIVFLGGLCDGMGTVIPGISGTAFLMILGIYNTIINTLSNLTDLTAIIFNIKILLPFGLGAVVAIAVVSVIMDRLLKKHKDKTYSIILGIVLSSVALLAIRTFSAPIVLIDLFIGIVLFILGIFISFKLDK